MLIHTQFRVMKPHSEVVVRPHKTACCLHEFVFLLSHVKFPSTVLRKVLSRSNSDTCWKDIDEPCPLCFAWSPTGELCLVGTAAQALIRTQPPAPNKALPEQKQTQMPLFTSRRGTNAVGGAKRPLLPTEVEWQQTAFGSMSPFLS